MERAVNILRCRRTGAYILNPQGTFRNYGGYVGINPYRELSTEATPSALGALIVEFLTISGPTGVAIAEAREFLRKTADEETRRIRAFYKLDTGRRTTAIMARRFGSATAAFRDGQKSWSIQAYAYDSGRRLLSGEQVQPVRVRHRNGAEALGLTITMGGTGTQNRADGQNESIIVLTCHNLKLI